MNIAVLTVYGIHMATGYTAWTWHRNVTRSGDCSSANLLSIPHTPIRLLYVDTYVVIHERSLRHVDTAKGKYWSRIIDKQVTPEVRTVSATLVTRCPRYIGTPLTEHVRCMRWWHRSPPVIAHPIWPTWHLRAFTCPPPLVDRPASWSVIDPSRRLGGGGVMGQHLRPTKRWRSPAVRRCPSLPPRRPIWTEPCRRLTPVTFQAAV